MSYACKRLGSRRCFTLVSVCVSGCLCVWLFVCLSVFVSLAPSCLRCVSLYSAPASLSICVCVTVSLSLSLSLCVSFSLCVCLCFSVCLSVSVCLCPSLSLSLSPAACRLSLFLIRYFSSYPQSRSSLHPPPYTPQGVSCHVQHRS